MPGSAAMACGCACSAGEVASPAQSNSKAPSSMRNEFRMPIYFTGFNLEILPFAPFFLYLCKGGDKGENSTIFLHNAGNKPGHKAVDFFYAEFLIGGGRVDSGKSRVSDT
jgi:hypothetical protein